MFLDNTGNHLEVHETNTNDNTEEMKTEMSGICDDSKVEKIPEEIMIKIFSYLPSKDVLNAKLVCRKWRNDALYVLHRKITILNFGMYKDSEADAYRDAMESYRKLESISCQNVKKEFVKDVQEVRPNIENFLCSSTPAKWYDCEEACQNVEISIDISPVLQLRNLKKLSFEGMGLSLSENWLTQLIENGPQLDVLSVDVESINSVNYVSHVKKSKKVLMLQNMFITCGTDLLIPELLCSHINTVNLTLYCFPVTEDEMKLHFPRRVVLQELRILNKNISIVKPDLRSYPNYFYQHPNVSALKIHGFRYHCSMQHFNFLLGAYNQ